MQNHWKKRLAALAVCLVLICAEWAAPAFARAETFATYGNAATETTFFVTTAGQAVLTLSQSGMGRLEMQSVYNVNQRAEEYAYAQYMVLYKGSRDAYWQQGAFWMDKLCTLNFTRADVYTVRILPTDVQNMQPASGATWRYSRWLMMPSWYVSGVKNCAISSMDPLQVVTPVPTQQPTRRPTPTALPYVNAPVTLIFQTTDGYLLQTEIRYLSYGIHTVLPGRSFAGYYLVSDGAQMVNVEANGVADPAAITFVYQANETPVPTRKPTPKPTAAPVTGEVTILYRTDDGKLLSTEQRELSVGTHNVKPSRKYKGYQLISDSSVKVTVSSKGSVKPNSITFIYELVPTEKPTKKPTPKPTKKPTPKPTVKPATGKVVSPVDYDTQFKEGTSKHNADRGGSLYKLFDNDKSTVFRWTYWTSEVGDDIPEITAYFGDGGVTIGSIGVRNGDASSSKNYFNNARATRFKVRLTTADGKAHSETLNLSGASYSGAYQVKGLSRVYKNVEKVEFFMTKGYLKGGKTNKNAICISDIQFYSE